VKTNQKGFTLVEGLLTILVVSFISFAGWYVYDANKQKPEVESQASENSVAKKSIKTSKSIPLYEKQGWITFEPKNKAYKVNLPNGAEFITSADSASIYSRSIIGSSSSKATITELMGGSDNPLGLFINYLDKDQISTRGTKQPNFNTYSGVNVENYTYKQTSEPQLLDIPNGATESTYVIYKGDKAVNVIYTYLSGGNAEIVKEMVKTIKIY
jgi:type II secretory pathway pseudopilin PulG